MITYTSYNGILTLTLNKVFNVCSRQITYLFVNVHVYVILCLLSSISKDRTQKVISE